MLRDPWTNGRVHGEITETRTIGSGPYAGKSIRTKTGDFHGKSAPTDIQMAQKLAATATVVVETPSRITLDKETKDVRKRKQLQEQSGVDAAFNLYPELENNEIVREELLALAPAVRASDLQQIGSDAQ